jgi:hypothetical protein
MPRSLLFPAGVGLAMVIRVKATRATGRIVLNFMHLCGMLERFRTGARRSRNGRPPSEGLVFGALRTLALFEIAEPKNDRQESFAPMATAGRASG